MTNKPSEESLEEAQNLVKECEKSFQIHDADGERSFLPLALALDKYKAETEKEKKWNLFQTKQIIEAEKELSDLKAKLEKAKEALLEIASYVPSYDGPKPFWLKVSQQALQALEGGEK